MVQQPCGNSHGPREEAIEERLEGLVTGPQRAASVISILASSAADSIGE
jgi:hypothetical protein